MLGIVAQQQRQWPQAQEYFVTALLTFVAYKDPNLFVTIRQLVALEQEAPTLKPLAEAMAAQGELSLEEAQALVVQLKTAMKEAEESRGEEA
ncbi:MAG TPA: hypothetical protein DCE41_00865 [Cytophagales bacterium]|nr:hypothetical protein [Cytophagales bacterium]